MSGRQLWWFVTALWVLALMVSIHDRDLVRATFAIGGITVGLIAIFTGRDGK